MGSIRLFIYMAWISTQTQIISGTTYTQIQDNYSGYSTQYNTVNPIIQPTGKVLIVDGWFGYGTGSLPSNSPYSILFPQYWTVASQANPPWMASGINATGYYLLAQLASPNASNNPGAGVYRSCGNMYQSLVHGFWFRVDTMPSGSVAMWRANDSQDLTQTFGRDQIYLSLSSAGQIDFRNSANTSFGTTGANLATGQWYFFDIYYFIGDTNGGTGARGAVQLNIYTSNGALYTNISNVNCPTRSFTFTSSYIANDLTFDGEFDNQAVMRFGPYYIVDPQGTGTNAMRGVRYFAPAFLGANSTPQQFTASTGGDHLVVLNHTPPGTDYLSDATQGQQDFYTIQQYSQNGGVIDCMALLGVAESDNVGARVYASIVNSTGLTSAGTHGLTNGTYATFCDIYPIDPSTAVAWLIQNLNKINAGIYVIQ